MILSCIILKNKQIKKYSGFIKNNYMLTQPSKILKHNIDGYFAAYLKKEMILIIRKYFLFLFI